MASAFSKFPFFISLLLFFTACGKTDRFVIYADPWLGDYTVAVLDEWQADHPNIEVHLRILSTEVIAQHLHYGQVVDLVMAFGEADFQTKQIAIADKYVIAESRILKLSRKMSEQQSSLGGKGCMVVAASDRPLRRYTEKSFLQIEDSCLIYSDFYRQTRDYLRRGWVSGGYVPEVFVRRYPENVEILGKGPTIPEAFLAIRPEGALAPELAQKFIVFLQSEKSKLALAEFGLIP